MIIGRHVIFVILLLVFLFAFVFAFFLPFQFPIIALAYIDMNFPGGSVVKNPPANAGDAGSIPGLGRSLEKEMATHSSILAWRIPGTGEPGGLPSMGSHRVGHD